MHERFFYVTIDAEQNRNLVEDLSTKFVITDEMAWRETDRVGKHEYKQSNLCRKIEIWKCCF